MDRVCVSSSRCCVFVFVVHPVTILSTMFCSLMMFVSDASSDHMVETYSSMGLVMALYVAMIVSFCFPYVVVISMYLLYVSLGSRVWCEENAYCLVWVEDEVFCPSPCMYFMYVRLDDFFSYVYVVMC